MQRFNDVSDFMSTSVIATTTKVLVPLDGSEQAERTLSFLSAFAPFGNLEVFLISVVDQDEFVSLDEAGTIERQRHLRQTYLDQMIGKVGCGVVGCTGRAVIGAPDQQILAEAERTGADIILMSSHGHSRLRRWHLGGVADKVVRAATCKTLILGNGAQPKRISGILLPLDGSVLAEQAIPEAKRLAEQLGALIYILRVVKLPVLGMDATRFGYNTPEMLQAMTEAARQYVESISEQVGAERAEVIIGEPADVLSTYASSVTISLIVMATHGRGGVLRTALGSVTDRLLGGPCAVLVIPSAVE